MNGQCFVCQRVIPKNRVLCQRCIERRTEDA